MNDELEPISKRKRNYGKRRPHTGVCKCCNSPNRAEYEKLRLEERMVYQKMCDYAMEVHQEKYTPKMFWNHFKRHCKEIIERNDISEEGRANIIEEKLGETLDLIEELKTNLEILKKLLGGMIEKPDMDSKDIMAIRSCLSEIRLTVKDLADLTNNLRIKPQDSEDSERDEILEVLEGVDTDTAKQMLEKLESGR